MGIRPVQSFDEDESDSHAVIQAEFGHHWTFSAMRVPPDGDVNKARVPDKSRPDFTATGVFCDEHKQVAVGMEQVQVTTTDPELYVRIIDMQWPPRKGDTITKCGTCDTYQIKEVGKDSLGGRVLRLNKNGRPDP